MRGPTHGARWDVCNGCGTLNEQKSWGDVFCRRCGRQIKRNQRVTNFSRIPRPADTKEDA